MHILNTHPATPAVADEIGPRSEFAEIVGKEKGVGQRNKEVLEAEDRLILQHPFELRERRRIDLV